MYAISRNGFSMIYSMMLTSVVHAISLHAHYTSVYVRPYIMTSVYYDKICSGICAFMRLVIFIYIHDICFSIRNKVQKHACMTTVFNKYIVLQFLETRVLYKVIKKYLCIYICMYTSDALFYHMHHLASDLLWD